jgi:hypothetical protein
LLSQACQIPHASSAQSCTTDTTISIADRSSIEHGPSSILPNSKVCQLPTNKVSRRHCPLYRRALLIPSEILIDRPLPSDSLPTTHCSLTKSNSPSTAKVPLFHRTELPDRPRRASNTLLLSEKHPSSALLTQRKTKVNPEVYCWQT